jgi:hypothetical protein
MESNRYDIDAEEGGDRGKRERERERERKKD